MSFVRVYIDRFIFDTAVLVVICDSGSKD